MGFFKSGTQQTKSTSTAPGYVTPGLQYASGQANDLYNQNKLGQLAPQSSQTQQGIGLLTQNAQQPNYAAQASTNALTGLTNNGGQNWQMQNAANNLGGLAGDNQVANGINMIASSGEVGNRYRDLGGQTDQNFNKALDYQSQQTQDGINRQFAGLGAYGGTDYAKTSADTIANQRNVAASNNFNNLQSQKLAATQGLQSFQKQREGYFNDLGADQARRASLYGQQAAIGQQGVNNQLSAAGLLPTLNEANNYNGNSLLNIGGIQDAYNQSQLDQPQNKLNDYIGLLNSIAGNQSTSTQSTPQASGFQKLLGTAISAAPALGRAFGG